MKIAKIVLWYCLSNVALALLTLTLAAWRWIFVGTSPFSDEQWVALTLIVVFGAAISVIAWTGISDEVL